MAPIKLLFNNAKYLIIGFLFHPKQKIIEFPLLYTKRKREPTSQTAVDEQS
jgi:hypothetical protein